MSRRRPTAAGRVVRAGVMSVALAAVLTAPAAGNFEIQWETRQDGHLKMWWTTNGIRDPYPFIDSDIVVPPNVTKYEYHDIAPRKDINDMHEQWILAKNAFGTGTTWGEGDFDGNFDVDLDDFVILKTYFGTAGVPEPGALSLLLAGAVAVVRRGRRNR